jgi:hypothetical protein
MGLERKMIEEACREFYQQYHKVVEEKGYTLSDDSFMQAPEGFTIMAMIGNRCPDEMLDHFRKVLPMEFKYSKDGKEVTYPVGVGPSISDLFKQSDIFY